MSSITVSLVQTDIQWLNRKSNLENLHRVLVDLPAVDLIVLPETFATGFAFDHPEIGEPPNGPVLNWMQSMAQTTGAVIAGSVAVTQGTKVANRLYWVSPDGSFLHYDKRHLFRMGNEHEYVVAGQQRAIFTLKEFRILPQVCYDLRFPVWGRNRNDYDIMLNIANWPAARRKVYDTLLQARAMENQCYVLAVNRVGDDGKGVAHNGGTAAYDFKGELLDKVIDNQTGVVVFNLSHTALTAFKQQFPAYLDADDFQLL